MKRADDAKKLTYEEEVKIAITYVHLCNFTIFDQRLKRNFLFTPCIIKVDKTISLQSLLHEWMNKMHGISPT